MSAKQSVQLTTRPFLDVFSEAASVLRQDAAEYGYIAVVGAVAAGIAVLIPGIVGGPVALSIIGPLLALIAVGTLATSAAAFGCVSNHLQPDAASALAAALRRALVLLRPWLLLFAMLWAAGLGAAWVAPYLGPVPPAALLLAIAGIAWFYALPRSLCIPIALDDHASHQRGESVSAAIVRAMPRTFWLAWSVMLAPVLLVLPLGFVGGFDVVFGAVLAFVFVGTMPLAAALMSLLFFDAASMMDVPAPPISIRVYRSDEQPPRRRAA